MPGCCANPVFTAVQGGPGSKRIGQHIGMTRKPGVRRSAVGRGPGSVVLSREYVQCPGSKIEGLGPESGVQSPSRVLQRPGSTDRV